MAQRHYPGETIGIIGESISSAILAQEAGRLGYRVGNLVIHEDNPIRQFASWQVVVNTLDQETLEYFASRVDLVVVEKGLLTNQQFNILAQQTDLTLSEDLRAITTDRLIEKAYLDAHRILVAPFSLVTSLTDIKEAIEYIGFPAVLKSSQRHLQDAKEHVFLYSTEDYPQAEEKLQRGSCILESWIPTEKRVSLTAVRNERGEILIYPIFEIVNQGFASGEQVRYPAQVDEYITQEMFRIAHQLADDLHLIGSLTLTFLVTAAGVIYLNGASIGLSSEAMFTIGSMSVSHFEATIRAYVGLPLPKLRIQHPAAISYPLEALNKESVMTQYMLRTDWGFALFNSYLSASPNLLGQVVVTGDSLESCQRQVEITNLLAESSL
ncbi:ATP-grasp domain-containing protein [Ignavigranum ruoffiae]|uniref:5-(Carboxyamino)imidazole ribonucleotide synthase n=1 Tax=Ignavigranum ruoffiae TaxID=89093 RepID=A0A1H9AZH7_9LACT|nr:ATP-grasp domain-containing protein [Ignavigranum ruoffiae]UPQ85182.1 ATP-grasp domain-containing protein [Ignavigranum ruoffiae]SEP81871.1 5-(carboxyamino)imidazole ribonucleotide synthase [Ignavigranum ruoffiae]